MVLPWSSLVSQSGHALTSGGVGSPVSRLSNKHAPFTIACWLQSADILIPTAVLCL